MSVPHHILIVVNQLSQTNQLAISRALAEQSPSMIKISCAFIIPPIPAHFHQLPSIKDMSSTIHEDGENKLTRVAEFFGVPVKQRWLIHGQMHAASQELANSLGADLLIMEKRPALGAIRQFIQRTIQSLRNQTIEIPSISPEKTRRMLMNTAA